MMNKPNKKQQATHDQIDRLGTMDIKDLRAHWARLYSTDPPARLSRNILELGIAHKLQETQLASRLNTVLQRQLKRHADSLQATGTINPPERIQTLSTGTKLMRAWGGRVHEVLVLDDGFEWQGERWRSLSVIARSITGAAWSGPRFFGLKGSAPAAAQGNAANV
jgi:hypothetical protein